MQGFADIAGAGMNGANVLLVHIVEDWLSGFRYAVSTGGTAEASRLLLADCYWRDLVALTWAIRTVCGQEEVARQIVPALRQAGAIGFSLEASTVSPRLASDEPFVALREGRGEGARRFPGVRDAPLSRGGLSTMTKPRFEPPVLRWIGVVVALAWPGSGSGSGSCRWAVSPPPWWRRR